MLRLKGASVKFNQHEKGATFAPTETVIRLIGVLINRLADFLILINIIHDILKGFAHDFLNFVIVRIKRAGLRTRGVKVLIKVAFSALHINV